MSFRDVFKTKTSYSGEMYFHPQTGRQVKKEDLPPGYTTPTLPDVRLRHEKPFFGPERVAIELPNCGRQIVSVGKTTIRCILP